MLSPVILKWRVAEPAGLPARIVTGPFACSPGIEVPLDSMAMTETAPSTAAAAHAPGRPRFVRGDEAAALCVADAHAARRGIAAAHTGEPVTRRLTHRGRSTKIRGHSRVAQVVEQVTVNHPVGGSSPSSGVS